MKIEFWKFFWKFFEKNLLGTYPIQTPRLAIHSEGDCKSEKFVYAQWNDRKLAVPLEQLEPIGGDSKAIEVIKDWLYWCLMGYDF